MEIQKNGYSKNISLVIKKNYRFITTNASILTYKNNETQIILNKISNNKMDDLLFDAEIEVLIKFNFNNINQDLFSLLLLIYGLKKYNPKSVTLNLPYFPYTHKNISDMSYFSKYITINTDQVLITMLQNSGINTIKAYDLGNKYIKNYSNILVENVGKKDIFVEEFDFFKKTKKKVTIITLDKDDYEYFNFFFSKKENITIINIEGNIAEKTKAENFSILSQIKDPDNAIIYIFEKMLIRGKKVHTLISFLAKQLNIKELNLYVTHGVFAFGSYMKFNTLMEKYNFFNIVTTDSIYSYSDKLNKKQTEIYKLDIKGKIEAELKDKIQQEIESIQNVDLINQKGN